MYYLFYFRYVVVSTAVGLWVFLWALRNGQFRDQQRARFLPLQGGEETPAVKVSKFHRYQAQVLFGLLISWLAAAAALVVYALVRTG